MTRVLETDGLHNLSKIFSICVFRHLGIHLGFHGKAYAQK